MANSGLFGDNLLQEPAEEEEEEEEKSARDDCAEELHTFLKHGKKESLGIRPMATIISFWATEGSRVDPNMARAAQLLLAVPASSALLEPDFSTCGNLITGARSRLDGIYAGMILFLHGSTEEIPSEFPVLTIAQADKAMPTRLPNPVLSELAVVEDEVAQALAGADEFVFEQELAVHGVSSMPIHQLGGGRGTVGGDEDVL